MEIVDSAYKRILVSWKQRNKEKRKFTWKESASAVANFLDCDIAVSEFQY